ncbi:MAG: hypothetical protein ACQETB_09645 [Halobacteriota archaeon]
MRNDYAQGIRSTWKQFSLRVLTVFAVGLTRGAERNVVPIMGEETFVDESFLLIGSVVVSLGIVNPPFAGSPIGSHHEDDRAEPYCEHAE